jgi:hypothetical protein
VIARQRIGQPDGINADPVPAIAAEHRGSAV